MNKKFISLCVAAVEAVMIMGGSGVTAAPIPGMESYIEGFEKIRSEELPKIEELIKQCEDKKIPTDYEKANYRVIEKFIDIGIDDASDTHTTAADRGVPFSYAVGYGDQSKPNDKSERAKYIYDVLTKLADETEDNLNAYLNNEKEPIGNVIKYKTSNVTADGFSFMAENEYGEIVPTYFVGYGHFGEAANDIPIFADMGVNVIQIEVGPAFVMKLDENGNFAFKTEEEEDYVRDMRLVFESAEKHNVGICLLISPHYVPGFMEEKFPGSTANGYFTKGKMREMLAFYVAQLAKLVGNSPALHSVCLTNEPGFGAASENLKPQYIEYLKGKYSDISKLNENWGTEYASFDEIGFPDLDKIYDPTSEEEIAGYPALWEFMIYNGECFAEFHKFLYDLVEENIPGKLAGAKVMQSFDKNERYWRRMFINNGYVDGTEKLGEFLTINGNDANNYYDPQDYEWDILNKMSYYDLQASIRTAPVFDFEDHVIRDRNDTYGEEIMPKHVAADIWQGAVHQRGGSAIWTWERSYDDNHDFAGSILNRPDVVADTSKAMLDIHRLSEELTSLENTEKRIGILFSQTARLYSLFNSNAMTRAYEAASFTGERVDFVTENQAVSGKLANSDIEILVVPYSTNLIDGAAVAIADFIKAGGKVIVIGKDTLAKNQHNKPIDTEVVDYIMSNATVIDAEKVGVDQFDDGLDRIIFDNLNSYFGTRGVKLVNTDGTPAYGISYTYAEEDGSVIVNICNYDYENDCNVNVLYNGNALTSGIELRDMKEISLSGLKAESITPMLIRFDAGLYQDIADHWVNTDAKSLWAENAFPASTSFEPEAPITASELKGMARILFDIDLQGFTADAVIDREALASSAIEILNAKKAELVRASIDGFADAADVTNKESFELAVGTGIIAGMPDMTLMPKKVATRAEAVAVINRILNLK